MHIKKTILSALGALSLVAQTAFGAVGFTVSGSNLVDANGNVFIPVGVNNPHIWFDTAAFNALTDLAAKRVNCVRIVWDRSGSATRLDQIISRCEALKIVPMVELHNGTGSTSAAELNANAQYYANNAAVMIRHQRSILINIGNEWGNNSVTPAQWRDAYRTAITTIRRAGIVTTLVCDGPNWGQSATAALTFGQELLDFDPQHNLLFSVHMYGSWNNTASIGTTMASFKSRNLPLLIGEFGWNFNNGNNNLGCRVDHRALLNFAAQNGVGTLAWSLNGNNAENAWLDLTTNWTTPRSPWGVDIFNNIASRARVASIFGGTSTPPPPPPPSGGATPGNGTFRVTNRNSGKALDASGNGTADGTPVIQWTYGGGNNQRWILQDRGSSQFSIIGVGSGKALDVTGSSATNGTRIQLRTYSGANNQKWTFTATSGGNYRVTPVHATAASLDVTGSSTADGAFAQIWAYNGGNSQQWSFSAP